MKPSAIKAVRNTLLAFAVGTFLPSIASADHVSPWNDSDHDSVFPSPSSESAVFDKDSKWDQKWDHKWSHKWKGDLDDDDNWNHKGDLDDNDGSTTSSTVVITASLIDPSSNTPAGGDPPSTPEPSTLALLGLGAIAVGLGLSNRRTKPAAV